MLRAYPAAAVQAAEEPLLAAGPPGALMAHASFALATEVMRELRARGVAVSGTAVLALVGGGNNGGDALHAAAYLAHRGASVTAALLTAHPHADGAAAAVRAGVRLVPLVRPAGGLGRDAPAEKDAADLEVLASLARSSAVWVDGLAGIGVRGALRGPAAAAVTRLDALRRERSLPPLVVAVDTPSGIGVDDGTVPGPVLPADLTVTMGVPKPGLLLSPAAALAGRVVIVDIGIAEPLRRRRPDVARLTEADVADLWPVPDEDAHKYSRGVLGLVAGSERYPGAGLLAIAGAQGVGAGMVRFLGAPAVLRLAHAAHPEVVSAPGRVQAWTLGPGSDPDDEAAADAARAVVRASVAERLPVVLDAGAVDLVAADLTRPGGGDLGPLWPGVVLTPHAGELARLLRSLGEVGSDGAPLDRAAVEATPATAARVAARRTGATVLLKGAVTVVAPPEGTTYAQADATPWLATAGAGDVLAGALGALLAARGADVRRVPALAPRLAAAAALVHGHAARLASAGGPVTAGDVAAHLPAAVAAVLAHR